MKKARYEMAGGFFAAYSYVVTMLYGGTEGANNVARQGRYLRKLVTTLEW